MRGRYSNSFYQIDLQRNLRRIRFHVFHFPGIQHLNSPTALSPVPIYAVLYYDGKCPLCAQEMRWLQKLARKDLQLVDVHKATDLTDAQKEMYLRTLHLRDASGHWLKGVDASVAAWSYTALGFLLRPLRWRVFTPLVDRLYARWADRRYCKRYACDVKAGTAKNLHL